MIILDALARALQILIYPDFIIFIIALLVELILCVTAVIIKIAVSKNTPRILKLLKVVKRMGIFSALMLGFLVISVTFLMLRPTYIDTKINEEDLKKLSVVTSYDKEEFNKLLQEFCLLTENDEYNKNLKYSGHKLYYDYYEAKTEDEAKKIYDRDLHLLYVQDMEYDDPFAGESDITLEEKQKHVVTYEKDGLRMFCSPIVIERTQYWIPKLVLDNSNMYLVIQYDNIIIKFHDDSGLARGIKLPSIIEEIIERL